MQQRVYGLETEYAIGFETQHRQMQKGDKGVAFHRLKDVVLAQYPSLVSDSFGRDPAERGTGGIHVDEGHFLESGARFYYDTGHIEWATPEAPSAQEAILYELAGQKTLTDAAVQVPLPNNGRYVFIKNNVDYMQGTTYGCHENYLVTRSPTKTADRRFFNRLVHLLSPFLVTRQIFCGAGKIGGAENENDSSTVGYQLSQRADFIECVTSEKTRSERAIVNLRDESLGDETRFRRLHLILGDSNMSDYANVLKLGTTGIVLRLIEEGALNEVPALENPVAAIKIVSRDLSCQTLLPLADGGETSAIAVQQFYLQTAKKFFQKNRIDADTQQILDMWQEVLDDLAIDPLLLADRVDWVIKYKYLLWSQLEQANTTWEEVAIWSSLIEKLREQQLDDQAVELPSHLVAKYQYYLNEHKLSWNDYGLQRRLYYGLRERDLRYHDIDPEYSLYYVLQNAGKLKTIFSKREIREAQHQPPETRAQIRAQVIRWANDNGRTDETLLDWGRVQFSKPNQNILLVNPLDTLNKEVNNRIQSPKTQSRRKTQQKHSTVMDDMDIRIIGEENLVEDNIFQKIKRKIFR